jgi:hypothetical protein
MKKALFAITLSAAFALAYIERVPVTEPAADKSAAYFWGNKKKKWEHREIHAVAGYRWHQKRWDQLEPVVG